MHRRDIPTSVLGALFLGFVNTAPLVFHGTDLGILETRLFLFDSLLIFYLIGLVYLSLLLLNFEVVF